MTNPLYKFITVYKIQDITCILCYTDMSYSSVRNCTYADLVYIYLFIHLYTWPKHDILRSGRQFTLPSTFYALLFRRRKYRGRASQTPSVSWSSSFTRGFPDFSLCPLVIFHDPQGILSLLCPRCF